MILEAYMGWTRGNLNWSSPAGKTIDKENGWTTTDEIDFLNHLGTHSERGRSESLARAERLRKVQIYLDSMGKRKNWGKVDPDKVRKHAQHIIRVLSTEIIS